MGVRRKTAGSSDRHGVTGNNQNCRCTGTQIAGQSLRASFCLTDESGARRSWAWVSLPLHIWQGVRCFIKPPTASIAYLCHRQPTTQTTQAWIFRAKFSPAIAATSCNRVPLWLYWCIAPDRSTAPEHEVPDGLAVHRVPFPDDVRHRLRPVDGLGIAAVEVGGRPKVQQGLKKFPVRAVEGIQ